MSMAPSMVVPILEDYYPAQTGDAKDAYQVQTASNGDSGFLSGSIPLDYGSMVEFAVYFIGGPDGAVDCDTAYLIRAGKHGEAIDHVQSEGVIVVTYVSDITNYINLTPHIPAFDPGDVFGVALNPDDVAVDIHILGTRMKYRPRYPVQ